MIIMTTGLPWSETQSVILKIYAHAAGLASRSGQGWKPYATAPRHSFHHHSAAHGLGWYQEARLERFSFHIQRQVWVFTEKSDIVCWKIQTNVNNIAPVCGAQAAPIFIRTMHLSVWIWPYSLKSDIKDSRKYLDHTAVQLSHGTAAR